MNYMSSLRNRTANYLSKDNGSATEPSITVTNTSDDSDLTTTNPEKALSSEEKPTSSKEKTPASSSKTNMSFMQARETMNSLRSRTTNYLVSKDSNSATGATPESSSSSKEETKAGARTTTSTSARMSNFLPSKGTMTSLRNRTTSYLSSSTATTTTTEAEPEPNLAPGAETSPVPAKKKKIIIDPSEDHHEDESLSDHNVGDNDNASMTSDLGLSIVASVMSGAAGLGVGDFTSDEIASDPEIIHMNREIRMAKSELARIKKSGLLTQQRRTNQDLKLLNQKKNTKSRQLWIKNQGFKHNFLRGYLTDYKSQLMKISLPSHDTSTKTLTAEAQLLRQQHINGCVDHQMSIVQNMQSEMIDYMYNTVLPEIRNEHELAKMVGENQVVKARQSKDSVSELYEQCLGLQRKIIAKYRLREIEHQNVENHHLDGSSGHHLDDSEIEALKVAAGEVPAMERDSELRDSAKERMEARKAANERMKNRRLTVEERQKNVEDIVQQEKDALDRVSKHNLSLSDHSVDLLNQDLNGDDNDDEGMSPDSESDNGEFGNDVKGGEEDSERKSSRISSSGSDGGSGLSAARRRDALRAAAREDKEGEGDSTLGSSMTSIGSQASSKSGSRRRRQAASGAPASMGVSPSGNLARLRALRGAREKKGSDEGKGEEDVDGDTTHTTSTKDESSGSESHSKCQDDDVAETKPVDNDESNSNDISHSNDDDDKIVEESCSEQGDNTESSERSNDSNSQQVGKSSAARRALGSRRDGMKGGGARSDLLERARSARQLTLSESKAAASGAARGLASKRPNLGSRASSSRDFKGKTSRATSKVVSSSTTKEAEPMGLRRKTSLQPMSNDRQARLDRLKSKAAASSSKDGVAAGSRDRSGKSGLSRRSDHGPRVASSRRDVGSKITARAKKSKSTDGATTASSSGRVASSSRPNLGSRAASSRDVSSNNPRAAAATSDRKGKAAAVSSSTSKEDDTAPMGLRRKTSLQPHAEDRQARLELLRNRAAAAASSKKSETIGEEN